MTNLWMPRQLPDLQIFRKRALKAGFEISDISLFPAQARTVKKWVNSSGISTPLFAIIFGNGKDCDRYLYLLAFA